MGGGIVGSVVNRQQVEIHERLPKCVAEHIRRQGDPILRWKYDTEEGPFYSM